MSNNTKAAPAPSKSANNQNEATGRGKLDWAIMLFVGVITAGLMIIVYMFPN